MKTPYFLTPGWLRMPFTKLDPLRKNPEIPDSVAANQEPPSPAPSSDSFSRRCPRAAWGSKVVETWRLWAMSPVRFLGISRGGPLWRSPNTVGPLALGLVLCTTSPQLFPGSPRRRATSTGKSAMRRMLRWLA